MTVAQLRRAMPSAEFNDWIAFFEKRQERLDEQTAQAKKEAAVQAKRERLMGRRMPRGG